jgi:hypothetical protein
MLIGSSNMSFAIEPHPTTAVGGSNRIPSTEVYGTRRTSSPSDEDISHLGAELNLSAGALRTNLSDGGLLSFTADARGVVSPSGASGALRGLPLDDWGTPDFDAIKAAGGTVTGTIPPNGGSKLIVLDGHRTVYYAAQIEFPDGRTQFVRGWRTRPTGPPEPRPP